MEAVVKNGRILLKFPYDFITHTKVKAVPGGKFNKRKGAWEFPASPLVCAQLNEKLKCSWPLEAFESGGYPLERPVPKMKPFDHQAEAIDFLLNEFGFGEKPVFGATKGAALFMEMGTGKTKTAIDTAEILHHNGIIKTVLIISPLNVVDSWGNTEYGELTKHSTNSKWYPIVGATKKKKLKVVEEMKVDINLQKKDHLTWGLINIESLKVVRDQILEINPDLVILDESTLIKNFKAARTKDLLEMFGLAPYKIVMSGNPIPKGPHEIFAQYAFIEPGVFGLNFFKFRDKYFDMDYFKQIEGLKEGMKAEFDEKFHSVSIVKRKDECLDLPPKLYEPHVVEMSKEQGKAYREMEREAVVCYDDMACSGTVVMTKMIRLSQIAGGALPLEPIDPENPTKEEVVFFKPNSALNEVIQVIEETPDDEQVVVWARFQFEIELICERLEKEDIGHADFYGKTSLKNKLKNRADFKNRRIRVFVGSPAAGGKGMNDLIGATTVIYYSNDYSAENRQQSEDRNHREGTIKVTYHDIIVKGTIDIDVLNTLRDNKDFSDKVLTRELMTKGETT